jgi:hypothetical protein
MQGQTDFAKDSVAMGQGDARRNPLPWTMIDTVPVDKVYF